MTTTKFEANGKEFKTYAEARAVSRYVTVNYYESFYTPTGTPEKVKHRNELIKKRKAEGLI